MSRAGFTLIEVLIALLILAVGLLGLQAMQVIGVRAITRAGRGTEHTLLAVQTAERAAAAMRRGETPSPELVWELDSGDTVRQVIIPGPPPRVRVTVVPNTGGASGLGPADSVSISLIP